MSDSPVSQVLSSHTLLDAIRRHGLLSQARLEEAAREEQQGRFGDVRALCRWLMERDWVTAYQINRMQRGQVQELLLGPYVLMEPLAEEATGQLFKARHRVLNRVVALKVIRRELAAKLDADAVRRFYSEVEMLARLDHPHVGHAHDAGPVGSTHFLAAEYVEGVDLEAMVKKQGPLLLPQAIDYVCQISSGLQYLLEHGLVHHNLQPSNVIVTKTSASDAQTPPPARRDTAQGSSAGRFGFGQVKLFNFGLSSLAQKASEEAGSGGPAGAVKDVADYSAPEYAIDPSRADIRADLYSLGCIFYFLLTGREPIGRHKREGAELLKQLRPETPDAVVTVVRRLMAGRLEDRYATPVEVLSAFGVQLLAPAPLMEPLMHAPAIAPPRRPASKPGEKIVPADWDAITSEEVPEERPRASFPWKAALAVGALAVVGALAAVGILAAVLSHSRPSPDDNAKSAPTAYDMALANELKAQEPSGWVPIRPWRLAAKEGTTLKILDDSSVLGSEKNPDRETFSVTMRPVQKNIAALRVEMMPHETLVGGLGLSRHEAGNFVLSAIEVEAAPDDISPRTPVKIARAAADFSQADFPIESLLKTPPGPGWAVGGMQPGQTRKAMFVFAQPIPGGLGAVMTVRLHFQSPNAKHVPGHFRLSVTTSPNPAVKD
jgi:serine/threonine protein kinase